MCMLAKKLGLHKKIYRIYYAGKEDKESIFNTCFMQRNKIVGGIVAVSLFVAGTVLAVTTNWILPNQNGPQQNWSVFPVGMMHVKAVGEPNCDGKGTYVYTSTMGLGESFRFPLTAIPTGATITGLEISPCVSKAVNMPGTSTLKLMWNYNRNGEALVGNMTGSIFVTNTIPTVYPTSTLINGLNITHVAGDKIEVGAYYYTENYGQPNLGLKLSNLRVRVIYQ